jgi:hypothetical protein
MTRRSTMHSVFNAPSLIWKSDFFQTSGSTLGILHRHSTIMDLVMAPTVIVILLMMPILILKAAPVECINRELDDAEKEHCKKVTMKVLIAVIVFAGCCTLAGIPDILSLVALTSFIILISQYVGILKYKIEKSKNKRR